MQTEPPAPPLGNATLSDLPGGIETPRYDRGALNPGIVHIGMGNFHRAHQAWYLHRLMQQGKALDWAIIGAGVRAADAVMREKLLAQDCLTTLIELGPDGVSAEVIGSVVDFLPVEPGHGPLIRQMCDPAIRIVSLTITEGGYYIDPATGRFDADHPDIRKDVNHPDRPETAFGAILAALKVRRATGLPGFSVQSCDNLQRNGAVVRNALMGLTRLSDPAMEDWIAQNVAFPDSMVDCIVPATGPGELALARRLGVVDAAPVTHEDFRQWVVEDRFCAGRPPWEDAGVTMTGAVHAYEAMKIRVLNAGHQLLGNAGELMSLPTIADCMGNELVSGFFRKVQQEEILPFVAPVPGMTPAAYLALVERRFANPAIHDTTRRVAFDGSSRHTGFLLPILRDGLDAGGSGRGLALAEALWARMCYGTRENGAVIEANDPNWTGLHEAARAASQDPRAWLEQRQYYGDLAGHTGFASAFAFWLDRLWAEGTGQTIARYLSDRNGRAA